MKKLLFPVGATAMLLLSACQKDVSDGGNLSNISSNESKSVIAPPTSQVCDVINFTNYSGLLSSVNSASGLGPIAMTSFNSRSPEKPVAAMVFNSAAPHWEDLDLGTPNAAFGGPGVGAAGAMPATINNVPLGNILVIQNFIDWGMVPNDDDVVSNITFDFSSVGKITAKSVQFIDVEHNELEGGYVKLYDQKGGTLLKTISIPHTGANGVLTVSLENTPGVGYIYFDLNGSMAIDNLSFCVDRYSPCTYTQGYWKNHPEAWPVNSMMLGTVNYTKAQLISILKEPVRGNGLISLAHQLIAAKLNVYNGANSSAVSAYITAADNLIGSRTVPPVGSGSLATSATSSVASKLDQYNNGIIGPGHCN